jgi:hypothetical protein
MKFWFLVDFRPKSRSSQTSVALIYAYKFDCEVHKERDIKSIMYKAVLSIKCSYRRQTDSGNVSSDMYTYILQLGRALQVDAAEQ